MKRVLIVTLLLLTTLSALPQNWDYIKTSSLYLTGEGYGATIEEADRQALSDLISKIAVNVSSVTSHSNEEKVVDDNVQSVPISVPRYKLTRRQRLPTPSE